LGSCSPKQPILKIGLVADPQYANKETAGKRYYRESLNKLAEAIDTFNYNQVDFVQNLGDIIDIDWNSYDSILSLYKNLNPGIENYHLLGNHDFSIDSTHLSGLLETLSMPDFYYAYEKKGWRFIVLDATDYAYFSNPLHQHDLDEIDAYFEKSKGNYNHYTWNSAIGPEQQNWLKQELESAKSLGQKVIIFSHMPVKPLGNAHNVWNNDEILKIIENSQNVVAFINGHNHAGDYVYSNGIHYITLFGMVDTPINSYGILEIFEDHLVLKGYGNQKDLIINE
jgi:hypothetical protein